MGYLGVYCNVVIKIEEEVFQVGWARFSADPEEHWEGVFDEIIWYVRIVQNGINIMLDRQGDEPMGFL